MRRSLITQDPRVLHVVLSLNPGGTERLVIELARRLQTEIPAMVCCLDEPGMWSHEIESVGVPVEALSRAPGFKPGLGRDVAGLAKRHRATVIHAHHYSPFVYSCIARLWHSGIRVVFTEHGRLTDAPPSSKRRLANRLLARIPDRVFAVSENLKSHLVTEGFAGEEVDVIYNGIDAGPLPGAAVRCRRREELGAGDETLVVGTIARLDPVKDLSTLIESAAAVAKRVPVLLVIIGDGPQRASLEDLAARVGMESSTRFLGHLDSARDWLAAFDVYVNSSVSEGVSLTILEAMAAGLPIIATRVGGTPEVVDATCGRLVPPKNPAGLAVALVDLALDPSLRRDFGRVARHRLEARFTLDRMVRQYRDVYVSATPASTGRI